MQQFRIVHSAVHAGVATLCWWVLQHWEQVQARLADYRDLAVPAIIAGLAMLFRISDRVAGVIVEKIPLVSRAIRRALSGNAFVEGDWPLVVVDMERGRLLYLGFLSISFKDGQPYVVGQDWNPDGSLAHGFQSVQALHRDRMLQYWYKQGASLANADMRGYTEIYFFPHDGLAERHAGKFLDPKHTSDIRFYARRRRYGWRERRLADREAKLAAARLLWSDLEPRLAALGARDISVDFD